MLKKMLVIIISMLLTISILAPLALATNVSLTLSTNIAVAGDGVTASGTADAETFVSIKVLDSSQNIVTFDAVKSDQTGNYTCTFIVPTGISEGNLNVIAGYGENVTSQLLTIGTASTQVSLNLSASTAKIGDNITASGIADANTWVSIKVLDSSQNIVIYDAVKSDQTGNYTCTFIVPTDISEGNLNVIAGYGENVTSQILTIGTPTTKVSLTLSSNTAKTGDSITASGIADANTWVSIKVLDAAQNIIFYDALKADENGNYTATIIVPDTAAGDLTVVAGYGANVANQTLSITQETGDQCFIATAAYGSKFQPSVVLLRAFRDKFLLSNQVGQAFVKFYYHNSPPIAAFIAQHDILKIGVRGLLTPVVGIVYLLFHPRLMSCIIGLLLCSYVFWRIKKRATGNQGVI